jgi:DNA polymerase III delta prime subunit
MILEWPEIESVVGSGAHVLLYGPPGTGKTRAATSPESYSLTLTEETPAAELRGHYVPKGGEFQWQDGPAVKAWREGRRLVLNEIDRASGDALTFLLAALDDPEVARLTLPTGETIRPRPGYHAIATMNGDPDVSLPAPLLDRFSARIAVTDPHPGALARLNCEPLSNAIVATIGASSDRQVTVRQAWTFLRLASRLGDRSVAARAVWGERGTDVLNSLILAEGK